MGKRKGKRKGLEEEQEDAESEVEKLERKDKEYEVMKGNPEKRKGIRDIIWW